MGRYDNFTYSSFFVFCCMSKELGISVEKTCSYKLVNYNNCVDHETDCKGMESFLPIKNWKELKMIE